MRTCVIVIGCYRSGTSAAAGVLHHLGVDMGCEFDDPNRNNSSGFWEDIHFKKLNERLLEGENVHNEYCELIDQKKNIWGIKDPKLCHCFPFVIQCLDEMKCGYKVIDCNRDTKQIAKSIFRATSSESPDFWIPHIENYLISKGVNLNHYGGPLLTLQFEDIKDPYSYVENIARFVELPVTKDAINYLKNHEQSN